MKKIAIIGGGASGLVAAIAAARTNPQAQILIYEKKDSAGKKILATGNGRCNLTNKDMNASYFHSDNLSVVEEVFTTYPPGHIQKVYTPLPLSRLAVSLYGAAGRKEG